MPTARGTVRGLAEAPVGEAKWDIVENYACLQTTPMGILAPVLLWPAKGTQPKVASVALAARSAGSVLYLARPRPTNNAPTNGTTDKELGAVSAAEEDILRTGGTTVRDKLTQLQNTIPADAGSQVVANAAKALLSDSQKSTYRCF
jgi:hypothetical protein